MTAALMSAGLLTEIAGQSIPALARQLGTPVYVYDAAKIVERLGDLAAFAVVRFAQRSCSNLGILGRVRRRAGMVECVSGGEPIRGMAPGFKPGQTQHP